MIQNSNSSPSMFRFVGSILCVYFLIIALISPSIRAWQSPCPCETKNDATSCKSSSALGAQSISSTELSKFNTLFPSAGPQYAQMTTGTPMIYAQSGGECVIKVTFLSENSSTRNTLGFVLLDSNNRPTGTGTPTIVFPDITTYVGTPSTVGCIAQGDTAQMKISKGSVAALVYVANGYTGTTTASSSKISYYGVPNSLLSSVNPSGDSRRRIALALASSNPNSSKPTQDTLYVAFDDTPSASWPATPTYKSAAFILKLEGNSCSVNSDVYYADAKACPSNCNGSNGVCNGLGGTCTCSAGISGSDCSVLSCLNNCSGGNGVCNTSTGVCACKSGYSSSDCSYENCPTTTKGTCNGQGTCNGSNGKCSCNTGYSGSDCSVMSCPSNCSGGNGTCNTTTGVCACKSGYSSADCSFKNCPSTANGVCNNQGSCPGTNGKCINCNTGYSGDGCSIMSCPSDCSGHGTCVTATGNCACSSGYTGVDCSSKTCPSNCSGHGSCDSVTGACTCSSAYIGSACDTLAPAQSSVKTCPNNCSGGNGVCGTSTGVCACKTGFTLVDCSGKTCPNNCSDNGSCNTLNGRCTCTTGYSGDDCLTRTCPNDCSGGNGTCNTTTGVCACISGYSSSDCSFKNCPNNANGVCNNQGSCRGTDGTCICNTGYSGNVCATVSCPGNCNGQGSCNTSTGVCACNTGYTGTTCSLRTCPSNCSGHGSCNTSSGSCSCAAGYTGESCSSTPVALADPNDPCPSSAVIQLPSSSFALSTNNGSSSSGSASSAASSSASASSSSSTVSRRLASTASETSSADSGTASSATSSASTSTGSVSASESSSSVVASSTSTVGGVSPMAQSVVPYNGYLYAVIDGTAAMSCNSDCQVKGFQLPTGWSIAPDNCASRNVIKSFPFGTDCILSQSNGYNAISSKQCFTSISTQSSSTGSLGYVTVSSTTNASRICYKPISCNSRILIYRKDDAMDAGLVANRKLNIIDPDKSDPNDRLLGAKKVGSGYTLSDDVYNSSSSSKSVCVTLTSSSNLSVGGGLLFRIDGNLIPNSAVSSSKVLTVKMRSKLKSFISSNANFIDSDYSVYMDIFFSDGTMSYGQYLAFPVGQKTAISQEWRRSLKRVILPSTKTVDYINLYVQLRNVIGVACFNDLQLSIGDDSVSLPLWDQEEVKNTDGTPGSHIKLRHFAKLAKDDGKDDSNSYSVVSATDINDNDDDDDKTLIRLQKKTANDSKKGVVHHVDVDDDSQDDKHNVVCVSALIKTTDVTGSPDLNAALWIDISHKSGGSGNSKKLQTVVVPVPMGSSSGWIQIGKCLRSDSNNNISSKRRIKSVYLAVLLGDGHTGTIDIRNIEISFDARCENRWTSTNSDGDNDGESYGDPHYVTSDGQAYDFHARGEFVMSSDNVMTVQTRQGDAGNKLTINQGIAIMYKSLDRISIVNIIASSNKNDPTVITDCGTISLTIDGTKVPFSGGIGLISGSGNIGADTSSTHRQYRIVYPLTGHRVDVDVFVSIYGLQFMRYSLSYPGSSWPNLRGLVGSKDGNVLNDFTSFNGNVLSFNQSNGPSYDQLYGAGGFGESWRLIDLTTLTDIRESVFCYNAGETRQQYISPTASEAELKAAASGNGKIGTAEAKTLCASANTGANGNTARFNSCVVDMMATGDASFASSYTAVAASIPATSISVSSLTPATAQASPSSSGSSDSNVGVIIGVVIGCIAGVGLIVVGAVVWNIRETKRMEGISRDYGTDVDSGDSSATPKADLERQGSLRKCGTLDFINSDNDNETPCSEVVDVGKSSPVNMAPRASTRRSLALSRGEAFEKPQLPTGKSRSLSPIMSPEKNVSVARQVLEILDEDYGVVSSRGQNRSRSGCRSRSRSRRSHKGKEDITDDRRSPRTKSESFYRNDTDVPYLSPVDSVETTDVEEFDHSQKKRSSSRHSGDISRGEGSRERDGSRGPSRSRSRSKSRRRSSSRHHSTQYNE